MLVVAVVLLMDIQVQLQHVLLAALAEAAKVAQMEITRVKQELQTQAAVAEEVLRLVLVRHLLPLLVVQVALVS
jgi:hypothetical protein